MAVDRQPVPPERLQQISDPAERGAEAVRYMAYAESRIADARRIRDEAIQALRAGGMSRPKVADAVGVSVQTVRLVEK